MALISANLLIVSFQTHFWREAQEYLQPGPLSVAPSNTATNWNVVQLWEGSQDLN